MGKIMDMIVDLRFISPDKLPVFCYAFLLMNKMTDIRVGFISDDYTPDGTIDEQLIASFSVDECPALAEFCTEYHKYRDSIVCLGMRDDIQVGIITNTYDLAEFFGAEAYVTCNKEVDDLFLIDVLFELYEHYESLTGGADDD